MNTIKKYLALALVFSLCFGIFSFSNKEAFIIYAKDDKDKNDEKEDTSLIDQSNPAKKKKEEEEKEELSKKEEVKKTFAEKLGSQYGEMYAVRDFAKGLYANSSRHFAGRGAFDNYFNRKSSSEDSVFFAEFKKAFNEKYDEKSAELYSSTYQNGELEWYEITKKYATIEGQMSAYYDFTREKDKNWERAYNELIADGSVFKKFHSSDFSSQQEEDFEDQFKAIFQYSYEKFYLTALDREAMVNTNYEFINTEEKTLEISKPYYKVREGAIEEMKTPIQKVEVIFEKGTVFDNAPIGTPMALKLNEHHYIFSDLPKNLLPQTDVFELDLQRGINSVEFYLSPTLKFNGHANLPQSYSIGIYKWKDKRWKYVPTLRNVEDNFISTKIPTGLYHDTQYAVFFDKTYKMPNDIALNWAMEALDVAVRRQHVKYEVKLRPDDRITRGELADLIYRTLAYKQSAKSKETKPTDVNKDNEAAIMYCLNKGYLTKFADGTFKPELPVQYDHFMILMNRIYAKKFKMEDFVAAMLMKGHQSDYVTGINPYITRAEAIFAFYTYSD